MVVNPEKLTLKAAVAYYPECGEVSGKLVLPVLIMIGRDDQWARARSCEDLTAQRAGDRRTDRPHGLPGRAPQLSGTRLHGWIRRNSGRGLPAAGKGIPYTEPRRSTITPVGVLLRSDKPMCPVERHAGRGKSPY